MSIDISEWQPRPLGPTSEVYPLTHPTWVNRLINPLSFLDIPPGVVGALPGVIWPLVPKNILHYNFEFLNSAVGGRLEVMVSWDGFDFETRYVLPVRPGTRTMSQGILVAGWAMKLRAWSNDPAVQRNIQGVVVMEAM